MKHSQRFRCPYCEMVYDPSREEHEPMDDEYPTVCVIVPIERPHQRLRPDTF